MPYSPVAYGFQVVFSLFSQPVFEFLRFKFSLFSGACLGHLFALLKTAAHRPDASP